MMNIERNSHSACILNSNIYMMRTLNRAQNVYIVYNTNLKLDELKLNDSILIYYSSDVTENETSKFLKMNKRFKRKYENSFEITRDVYISFLNYLKKHLKISERKIWTNREYNINDNNIETIGNKIIDNSKLELNYDTMSENEDEIVNLSQISDLYYYYTPDEC